jgi:Flp pilus assembly protein TadD
MAAVVLGVLGLVIYEAADISSAPKADVATPPPPEPRRTTFMRPPTAYQSQQDLARHRPPAQAMPPDRLFATASPAVVRVLVEDAAHRPTGQGSGFVVAADGWIVTNYHVISLASFAKVVMDDFSELTVEGVAAVDREGDLALLKVSGHDLPCLLLADGAPPRVGKKVYAIGSPRGLPNTLSDGLISGHRGEGGTDLIQTTAAMSPGSSGGPLLTEEGWVVGVNARIRPGGQRLNFAIPAERVRDLLQKQGPVIPLASIQGQQVDGAVLAQLDKAWEMIEQQKWEDARKLLTTLAQTYPENPHVWFAWGHLCRRTGLYKPAIGAFETALKLKPDHAEACYELGATYLDQCEMAEIIREAGRNDDLMILAKQALLKAAELDPAGTTGRAARAALARIWPGEYRYLSPPLN